MKKLMVILLVGVLFSCHQTKEVVKEKYETMVVNENFILPGIHTHFDEDTLCAWIEQDTIQIKLEFTYLKTKDDYGGK